MIDISVGRILLCNPEEEVEYEYVRQVRRSGRAEETLLMMMVLTLLLYCCGFYGGWCGFFWEGLGHAGGGICVSVKGYGMVWYGKSL